NHPSRRIETGRQGLEIGECEPDRRSERRRVAGETQTKVGWLTKQLAMEVCQSKCLRGPGDVEQQRVRRYDEKHIDRVSAFEHFRTSRFGRCIESEIPRRRQVRSDGCPKLIQTRRCVARQRIADSVM